MDKIETLEFIMNNVSVNKDTILCFCFKSKSNFESILYNENLYVFNPENVAKKGDLNLRHNYVF